MTQQAAGGTSQSEEGGGPDHDPAARLEQATVNGWTIVDDSRDRVEWRLGRTTAIVERLSDDEWRAYLEREQNDRHSTVRLSHEPVPYEQAIMLADIYMTERTVVPPRFSGGQSQAEWLREHVRSYEYDTAVPDDYMPGRV